MFVSAPFMYGNKNICICQFSGNMQKKNTCILKANIAEHMLDFMNIVES